MAAGKENALLLVVAATAGNTLGSLGNYYLGRSILRWQDKNWFPFTKKYMHKPQVLFEKHGRLTLLLAGVPFIGNPITVTAGMLQVPLCVFIPLVATGKGLRYILVWFIYLFNYARIVIWMNFFYEVTLCPRKLNLEKTK